MSSKCLSAYTAPGCVYPEFINAYQNDDGSVTVTVRNVRNDHDGEGKMSSITLRHEEFKKFLADAAEKFS